MSELVFYVNGKKITEVNPSPATLLVDYLRYKLFLTGTKVSCGEGGCGSCTVMVSWFDRSTSQIVHYSVNACIVPICCLHGLAVTTVEALGSTKTKLHEIQKRLVGGHGMQCGFCSPGMIMSMYALLRSNPKPTELQIEHALKGNLCRCTGYRPILDSFRGFAKDAVCPMGEKCCKNQSKGEKCGTDLEDCDRCVSNPESDKQELIFPSELQISDLYDKQSLNFASDAVTWFRPVTLKELFDLKKQHPYALLHAGGTNLVFKLKYATKTKPLVVIAITQIGELRHFEEKENGLNVGSLTSMTLLERRLNELILRHPETSTRIFSSLLDSIHFFGSPQIRNRATIGGSLATASALADVNVLLLATGCRVKIASADGEREVNIQDDFFTGKSMTCLKLGEIIVGAFLPFSTKNEYFESLKQAPRKDLTLAEVSAGMHVKFEDGSNVVKNADLVFGGMSSTLIVAKKSSKSLIGRKWEDSILDDLMPALTSELNGLPTITETEKYKLDVAQGFVFKFFLKVYNKHCQNLDFLRLTKEEERHLFSNQRELEETHSGTQIYDMETKQSPNDTVGQPLPHKWSNQGATGQAVFVDDMLPSPGELYLALVTSTKPNAKILSVDTSKALAMKGVVCYLDHTSPVGTNMTGVMGPTEELFASKEVHYVGQTIGAIVAESHDIARRATREVIVQYEESEPIISIEDAISKNSFHPIMGGMGVINYGDVTKALATCDHVIEGEVHMGGQEHFYMETHSARCVPKGEDGEMEVHVGAQFQTGIQLLIASALNVPCNKVFIRTKRLGGAFGGKGSRMFLATVPTAIAAQKLNRPVRCSLERRQDMEMTGRRRPYFAKYKVGFNKDGKVLALDLDMYSNDGYYPEMSQHFMAKSMFHSDNCYAIPNMSLRGHLCKTNLPTTAPMRGAGVPQGVFVTEYWMSKVAKFLNQPQHKIQEVNMYHGGDISFISSPIEGSMRKCFEEVLKMSDYDRAREEIDEFNRKSTVLKKGIAVTPLKFCPNFPSDRMKAGAMVNVYLDGSVLLWHGGVESGQGLHTKMLQVASRALDVSIEKIHISETATAVIPNAVITAGSASSDICGAAILDACNQLNERLQPIKEANPTGKWEDWVKAAFGKKISLSASGYYNHAYNTPYDWKTGKGRPHGYYAYGAGVSQVEIDCLTGNYVIRKVDIVMDIGKSLNPGIDIGQIEGSFVMGVGLHALEEHRYGPDGQLQTIGAGKYNIPSISSIPLQMNVSLLKDTGNPQAVYSSKGTGEPPQLLSISVFFAIEQAIEAARKQAGLSPDFVLKSPATVQRIRLACGTEPHKLIQSAKK